MVEQLHHGHLGDRRKCPLWGGGRYGEGDNEDKDKLNNNKEFLDAV